MGYAPCKQIIPDFRPVSERGSHQNQQPSRLDGSGENAECVRFKSTVAVNENYIVFATQVITALTDSNGLPGFCRRQWRMIRVGYQDDILFVRFGKRLAQILRQRPAPVTIATKDDCVSVMFPFAYLV